MSNNWIIALRLLAFPAAFAVIFSSVELRIEGERVAPAVVASAETAVQHVYNAVVATSDKATVKPSTIRLAAR